MSTKVFVGNASWNTDNEGLAEAFAMFGPVKEAVIVKDRDTGRSRGFGFVTFDAQESADAAVNKAELDVDGRMVRIGWATDKRSCGGEGPKRQRTNGR